MINKCVQCVKNFCITYSIVALTHWNEDEGANVMVKVSNISQVDNINLQNFQPK